MWVKNRFNKFLQSRYTQKKHSKLVYWPFKSQFHFWKWYQHYLELTREHVCSEAYINIKPWKSVLYIHKSVDIGMYSEGATGVMAPPLPYKIVLHSKLKKKLNAIYCTSSVTWFWIAFDCNKLWCLFIHNFGVGRCVQKQLYELSWQRYCVFRTVLGLQHELIAVQVPQWFPRQKAGIRRAGGTVRLKTIICLIEYFSFIWFFSF